MGSPTASLKMLRLQALSPELIEYIMEQLPVPSVMTCKLVCRHFCRIIEDSVRLRYAVELYASGMVDGPPGRMLIAERLRRLKEYQRAWRHLDFSTELTIPRGFSFISISPNTLAQPDIAEKVFDIVHTPSKIRGLEEKRWQYLVEEESMDISKVLFEVDIDQDLMIMIEEQEAWDNGQPRTAEIQFRSLSTREPHPHARIPKLPLVEMFYDPDQCLCIQGDVLGWLQCEGDVYESDGASILQLWNWKTGILLLRMTCEQPGRCNMLAVYTLDLEAKQTVHLTGDENLYRCAFWLPQLAQGTTLIDLSIAMQAVPYNSRRPAFPVPFRTNPADRLFHVNFTLRPLGVHPDHEHSPFMLFVPSSTIFASLSRVEPGRTGRIFPWNEWGPRGTRLVEPLVGSIRDALPPPEDWHLLVDDVCTSSGLRALVAYGSRTEEDAPVTLEVYDFSPGVTRLAQTRSRETESAFATMTYVMEPSIVNKPTCFRDEVKTSLPYCMSKRKVGLASREGQFEKAVLLADGILVQDTGEAFLKAYTL